MVVFTNISELNSCDKDNTTYKSKVLPSDPLRKSLLIPDMEDLNSITNQLDFYEISSNNNHT